MARISRRGIAFIKRHEGVIRSVYLDPVGYPTGGCGHLLSEEEKAVFPVGVLLSDEQIDSWLTEDLAEAELAVTRLVKVPLTQNQSDALISFVFNVGEGNFKSSTLLRKLNRGDYAGAAAEFNRWTRARGRVLPGLVRRRQDESRLFLDPIVRS